jgi:hypothetical protein
MVELLLLLLGLMLLLGSLPGAAGLLPLLLLLLPGLQLPPVLHVLWSVSLLGRAGLVLLLLGRLQPAAAVAQSGWLLPLPLLLLLLLLQRRRSPLPADAAVPPLLPPLLLLLLLLGLL